MLASVASNAKSQWFKTVKVSYSKLSVGWATPGQPVLRQ